MAEMNRRGFLKRLPFLAGVVAVAPTLLQAEPTVEAVIDLSEVAVGDPMDACRTCMPSTLYSPSPETRDAFLKNLREYERQMFFGTGRLR